MTIATLEKKLKPLEAPVDNELLRWLYLHLPPQPIKSRKMHHRYSEAIRILMRESGGLDAGNRTAVGQYLSAVIPFVEQYEKGEFPIGPATPEEVFVFLMEQHDLAARGTSLVFTRRTASVRGSDSGSQTVSDQVLSDGVRSLGRAVAPTE